MIRLDWHTVEGGDLIITADAEARRQIQEIKDCEQEGFDSDNIMYEMLEYALCNGFSWTLPEDVCALTGAPILCESLSDQGKPQGNVYAFMSYQVTSPQQELLETGESRWTHGGYAA